MNEAVPFIGISRHRIGVDGVGEQIGEVVAVGFPRIRLQLTHHVSTLCPCRQDHQSRE